MPTLDSDSKLHVESSKESTPLYKMSVAEAREALIQAFDSFRPDPQLASISRNERHFIEGSNGSFEVSVSYPPEVTKQKLPVVIWFHGGGWTIGDMESIEAVCHYICVKSEAIVVNVDYRLAPEFKFPTAAEDAYAALCWVSDNASSLGIDKDSIVVAGTSAGGTLTITACLLALENGGPKVALQIPIYPCMSLEEGFTTPSREDLGSGDYGLSNNEINWLKGHYLRSELDAKDFRASPIHAASYTGLPKALIITAGCDPLLDDGLIYHKELLDAKVTSIYQCYDSTIHGFVEIPGRIKAGRDALDLIASTIRNEFQ